MARHWTFGQRVGAGLAVTVALGLTISVVAIFALRNVVASKDRVITVDAQLLVNAEKLKGHGEAKSAAGRGYLLTGDIRFLDKLRAARAEIATVIDDLKQTVGTEENRRLVDEIERIESEHQQALERVISLRGNSSSIDLVVQSFDEQVGPLRDQLDAAIVQFVSAQERLLDQARRASTRTATSAIAAVLIISAIAVFFALLVAVVLAKSLGRQVGTAVGQVQSSSAELQAAANQQATGAKEQATAMSEITSTITELLATSRQIAESAQRVAQVAEQTGQAARTGSGTVDRAHESIAGIRRQVDLVVEHMLELGQKSQQIGTVVDVVSELAEQTNILSINATIEAAGAGEGGKRFAVVADEIRKLAERVAGSTKEIRALIDDVRSAVNTTVMATETGSKAVDSGSQQFGEVASAFRQIASLVATTTEATREIELSTKQQTTAVEQVNIAIANVAQATRETEASSGQTFQTASQLAHLSKDLLQLVRTRAAA